MDISIHNGRIPMLNRLLFFLTTLLYLPFLTSFVEAQPLPPHRHPYLIDRHAAESDLFMGTMYIAQCNRRLAKFWLEAARTHDPDNEGIKAALVALDTWPKEESMRIYRDAKRRKSTELTDYYQAMTCDPSNALAAGEAQRILSERERMKTTAAR